MFQNVLFWTKTYIKNKRFLVTKKTEAPVIIWTSAFLQWAGEAGFEPAWAVLELDNQPAIKLENMHIVEPYLFL